MNFYNTNTRFEPKLLGSAELAAIRLAPPLVRNPLALLILFSIFNISTRYLRLRMEEKGDNYTYREY